MSFLSPFALMLAGAVALGVVALHLLTTRRPPPAMLPTARFVPLAEARAVARASRPTDLLLLALRVLAVLLIGAAFARPVMDAAGPAVRTVVMLDVSRAVADPAAARAIAAAEIGEGGALVVFDSAAREMPTDSLTTGPAAMDATAASTADPRERAAFGSLSPAFVVARRAAARIARGADSVRLVLVSPLVVGAVDAATESFRAGWPGRIDVIRVPAATDTARGKPATLVTSLDDDPLAPAVEAVGGLRGGHRARIVRQAGADAADAGAAGATGAASAGDPTSSGNATSSGDATSSGNATSSGDAASSDSILLLWPATFDDSVAPAGVTAFDPAGTGSATVVAPLARLPLDTTVVGSTVIARWNDGAAAAVQSPASDGCVRRIGIGVPLAGDLTLRAPFTRLLETLLAPCDGLVRAPLPGEAIRWLTPGASLEGDTARASASRLDAPLAAAADVASVPGGEGDRWPLILLALATALLVGELIVRRRRPA